MIRLMLAVATAAAFAIAAPAFAGPFDGTWKADMSSYKASSKPYMRLLANGRFQCTCSTPPEDFAVDKQFHPVAGHPSYDEAMVSVVDPNTVRFAFRLKGKPVFVQTSTVSADGQTLGMAWTDTSSPQAVTGESEALRVGPAPAGAHAISGEWRDSDKASVSDTGMSVTLMQTGNTLVAKSSDGTGYAAVIGGPYVKLAGVDSGVMVAVAMDGPRTMVVTSKKGDKMLERDVWTLSADGGTVSGVFTDLESGRVQSLTSIRQ